MEKTLKNKKIFLYNRKESKFRQKLLTFLFFLVLATIFWLLSALDHNYSTNITFPIKYIHHLSDKEMVGDIPSEITINVSGHGYTLLGSIVTSKNHPLVMQVISLSFLSLRSDSDIDFLLTKTLKEQFQRQIGNEVTVNYVSPDTLYYHFSPIVRKKVPIQANLDIEFAKQYM